MGSRACRSRAFRRSAPSLPIPPQLSPECSRDTRGRPSAAPRYRTEDRRSLPRPRLRATALSHRRASRSPAPAARRARRRNRHRSTRRDPSPPLARHREERLPARRVLCRKHRSSPRRGRPTDRSESSAPRNPARRTAKARSARRSPRPAAEPFGLPATGRQAGPSPEGVGSSGSRRWGAASRDRRRARARTRAPPGGACRTIDRRFATPRRRRRDARDRRPPRRRKEIESGLGSPPRRSFRPRKRTSAVGSRNRWPHARGVRRRLCAVR